MIFEYVEEGEESVTTLVRIITNIDDDVILVHVIGNQLFEIVLLTPAFFLFCTCSYGRIFQ